MERVTGIGGMFFRARDPERKAPAGSPGWSTPKATGSSSGSPPLTCWSPLIGVADPPPNATG
jgi:hypothetical protein